MPSIIRRAFDSDRSVITERSLDASKAFFLPLARGEPVTSELLAMTPDPFVLQGPQKGALPEMFETEGVWAIKNCVKEIIDRMEPALHTFIAINLKVKGTAKDHGQYYLLHPGQAINAMVIEETDFVGGRGYAGFEHGDLASPFGQVVLRADMVVGRHLWRGGWAKLGSGQPLWATLFCSDELASTIQRAGMSGWQFQKCELKLSL
jgi:hypothetical protein